jgi:hypothetical protein
VISAKDISDRRWGLEPLQIAAFAALFVIVATLAALSTLNSFAIVVALVLLLLVVAPRYPYLVAIVALVAVAFTPDYIAVPFAGTALPVNGRLIGSLLLLFTGVLVTPSHRDLKVRRAVWVVFILAVIWVLATYAAVDGRTIQRLAATFVLAGPDVAALMGVMLLASAPGGRRLLLLTFCIAGGLVAVQALIEFAVQRNFLLEWGLAFGPAAEQWTSIGTRFGLTRSAAAFGHPIELGVFFSLGILAAFEALRSRLLPAWSALTLATLMFLGQLATVSRGPIFATLAVIVLWALSARPMRLAFRMAVMVIILSLAFAAVTQVDVQGGLSGFVQTGDKGTDSMGGTAQHRVQLTTEFFKELRSPPLFGTAAVGDTSAGRTFITVDHEPLFLLLTKGLLGLVTYALLVVTPLIADVRRLGKGIMREPYAPLVAIDLALCGASVAFFGLLQVFVWVSIAIMWSTVARPTEFAERHPGSAATVAAPPPSASR